MNVTNKLTEKEFAERLDEVLDRVSQGEEFVIERDGEVLAVIRPLPSRAQPNGETAAASVPAIETPGTTWEEFTARVGDLQLPGDGFADDLEAIQVAQGIAEVPEWPDRSLKG
jgi:antitoxin (DNA-binding transcriptional repressor) of toxin-antitoxin stability system